MKQPYNTALYMRLSRDDENYGDSVSIETQRTILRQFAKDNQLHVMDEYIDDGWSGTNFERPNFKRMMDDVELGKINCIVTKDLSRFGREHVMMDYYLEFVFPEKKVRYIAVSDNEDTEKGLSDFVPFKNLFNEWFAKDTSRKVKTALHAKFAAGQHICTYAPIGYKKHSEVKNLLRSTRKPDGSSKRYLTLLTEAREQPRLPIFSLTNRYPRRAGSTTRDTENSLTSMQKHPKKNATHGRSHRSSVFSKMKSTSAIPFTASRRISPTRIKRRYASPKRNGSEWKTPTPPLSQRMYFSKFRSRSQAAAESNRTEQRKSSQDLSNAPIADGL